jgi:hypothetical protein
MCSIHFHVSSCKIFKWNTITAKWAVSRAWLMFLTFPSTSDSLTFNIYLNKNKSSKKYTYLCLCHSVTYIKKTANKEGTRITSSINTLRKEIKQLQCQLQVLFIFRFASKCAIQQQCNIWVAARSVHKQLQW